MLGTGCPQCRLPAQPRSHVRGPAVYAEEAYGTWHCDPRIKAKTLKIFVSNCLAFGSRISVRREGHGAFFFRKMAQEAADHFPQQVSVRSSFRVFRTEACFLCVERKMAVSPEELYAQIVSKEDIRLTHTHMLGWNGESTGAVDKPAGITIYEFFGKRSGSRKDDIDIDPKVLDGEINHSAQDLAR